jgi:putative flippase GtrA
MKIHKENLGEIIRYLIIGFLTTVISLLIYYSLTATILDANVPIELQIANVIQWIGAVTFAYFTNKYYVFRDKSESKSGVIKFFSSRIVTLLIDMLLMYIFVTKLSFNDKKIKIIVQVVVIVGNYVLSKFFVFNKKEEKTKGNSKIKVEKKAKK